MFLEAVDFVFLSWVWASVGTVLYFEFLTCPESISWRFHRCVFVSFWSSHLFIRLSFHHLYLHIFTSRGSYMESKWEEKEFLGLLLVSSSGILRFLAFFDSSVLLNFTPCIDLFVWWRVHRDLLSQACL